MDFELPPRWCPAIWSLAKDAVPDMPADLRSKLDAMTRSAKAVPDPVDATRELLEQIRDEIGALWNAQRVENAAAVPMEEAQRLLGCGRTALWKLRIEGKVHEAKRVGRRVMIMVESINALLATEYTCDGAAPRRRRTADPGVKRVRLPTTRLPA